MQTVDVLARVDSGENGELVQAGRLLDEERGADRVGIQFVHHGQHIGQRTIGRQFPSDAVDADLRAVAMFRGDVPPASRVVPHQHGAKAGHHTPLRQCGDSDPQLVLHSGESGLAIQNGRRHDCSSCHG